MVCKVCGMQNADDFVFCAGCGATLAADEPSVQEPSVQEPSYNEPTYNETAYTNPSYNNDPYFQNAPLQSDPGKGKGIAAMILGIVGLALTVSGCGCLGGWAGLACAIVASILGSKALDASQFAGFDNSKARLGKTFGNITIWVFVGLSLLVALFYLFYFGAISGAMYGYY